MIYFLIATIQVLPPGTLKSILLPIVEPVISAFGLKQRWNLFAPSLTGLNQYSTCVVTYDDGSMRLLEWPRMNKIDLADRFYLQRVRRFVTEVWAQPKWKEYWSYSAYNFDREFSYKSIKPQRIEFIFNSNRIPDFKNYTMREDLPIGYRVDNVFVYFPERKAGISK